MTVLVIFLTDIPNLSPVINIRMSSTSMMPTKFVDDEFDDSYFGDLAMLTFNIETCHQHISSPTSVSIIVATISMQLYYCPLYIVGHVSFYH